MTYEIKYRSEDEMKDSGIEWVSSIPYNWSVCRIKNYFTDISIKNYSYDATLLSLYTEFGVRRNKDIEEKRGNKSQTVIGYKKVKKNDLVVNKMLAWMGASGISEYDGVVSSAYSVYRLNNSNGNSKFFHYMFRDKIFSGECFKNGWGIMLMRWSITPERFRSIYIPVPNPTEQQKIANFLDIKTAQFDSIISKKEKLIEKLKEAKKSLISEVVTGKVKIVDGKLVKRRPEEMKDSGVKWLGMIPKEWETTKLKYIGKAIIGLTYSPDDIVDKGGTLVFRASNVKNGKIDFNDAVYINKQIPKKLKTQKGDILICSRSGSRNLIGKNATIDERSEGNSFGAFMMVFRSDMWEFLSQVFNSTLFDYQSSSFLTSTINQLTVSNLNNFLVPLPDEKEQKVISHYLKRKYKNFNTLISKTQLQIEKLKSAKQSLISEAVTGKIDLRDWEIVEEGGTSL